MAAWSASLCLKSSPFPAQPFSGTATRLETLTVAQKAPFSQGQVAQYHATDAHPLQAGDPQPYQFAHAPDLPFASFAEDKAQLFRIRPGDPGRTQLFAVEFKTVIEQGKAPLVERALDTHQVFLLHLRIVADQLARDAAVLGEDQQSGGIDVQPTRRCQALQVRSLKTLRIAGHLGPRRNQAHCRLVAVFGLRRNVTDRLVQQDRRLPRLCRTRLRGQGDHRIGRGPCAQLRHSLAIDEHQAALDKGIGLASRAEPAFRQEF